MKGSQILMMIEFSLMWMSQACAMVRSIAGNSVEVMVPRKSIQNDSGRAVFVQFSILVWKSSAASADMPLLDRV